MSALRAAIEMKNLYVCVQQAPIASIKWHEIANGFNSYSINFNPFSNICHTPSCNLILTQHKHRALIK